MEIKTLGELLQDILEEEEMYFSLHEFLLSSTEEERQEIEKKLTEKESEQFNDFMDGFTFVSDEEVYQAVCEYYEKVNNRAISLGELADLQEMADYYMSEKGLNFND